ncbi:hypothetical protein AMS68_003171 [Peltaster fructicola]|uniref:Phosphoglycerate mutase-like protein n=1 Tax=Peltaster fructicola TaxID=286661 RepID=A0A6H0XSE0_9PEZI|nr:hypothetical protein AMS68_003171 [Peltaster fructicola]
MGKPRMILLIRHAQSEGNKNREIHQLIPDHRVKLTDEGWTQAEDAGRHLRSLLRPNDTLQFFTSPYRRTRETTEGILRTLTAPDEDGTPSLFSRHSITVYEEPRIREQDFGNFQPCSAEMQRMWQERADYGHFFYRIPNGESAADAYDRISGFNESLWRQFNEPDFPSVCVLVTHGLMTRVFLMKWYHWSVEYFEDLRNINHCEFIVMDKNAETGKYILQNKLRTWSELKREKLEEAEEDATGVELKDLQRRNTLSRFLPSRPKITNSPPPAKWGGCLSGHQHDDQHYPRRGLQQPPASIAIPPARGADNGLLSSKSNEHEDHGLATPAFTTSNPMDAPRSTDGTSEKQTTSSTSAKAVPTYLLSGRDGGGTDTPLGDDHTGSDYFPKSTRAERPTGSQLVPQRRPTVEDFERWASESGMGKGVKADALGDEPAEMAELELQASIEVDAEKAQEGSVRESVY